jgi:regulatory protein
MDKMEALQRCMKLCSTKEYAPQEILDKVTAWGITENAVLEIIAELESEKFLDTFRYARYYVNDKIKFNKWGRIKIGLMLKQKRIPTDALNEAFAQVNIDEYLTILNEELRKKYKTIKEHDPYIIRGKLFQFAAGRGFESDLIHKAIDKLLIS